MSLTTYSVLVNYESTRHSGLAAFKVEATSLGVATLNARKRRDELLANVPSLDRLDILGIARLTDDPILYVSHEPSVLSVDMIYAPTMPPATMPPTPANGTTQHVANVYFDKPGVTLTFHGEDFDDISEQLTAAYMEMR